MAQHAMNRFKKRWEITQNWQLIFPLIGIIGLLLIAYKASVLLTTDFHLSIKIIVGIILFYLLLKMTLFSFKKLEHKWIVKQKWEMIRIFIVFAITGSTSAFIGRPLLNILGINKDNLNAMLYWTLFIIIGLLFYQLLLVLIGWLFGQFEFFWNFEKKMLKRLGLKRIFKE